MKSFKEFLLEATEFDLAKFKSDCAFLFDILKSDTSKLLMYHGTQVPLDDWSIEQWRERDKPRNTPVDVHNMLNDYFIERFGSPIRNWLFVTGRKQDSEVYSVSAPPRVIFPMGKFEWVCGQDFNLQDLTSYFDREALTIKYADVTKQMHDSEIRELAAQYMIKQMNKMPWLHNSDLPKAIKSHNEIMLKCDKYYCFNASGPTFNTELLQFLETL